MSDFAASYLGLNNQPDGYSVKETVMSRLVSVRSERGKWRGQTVLEYIIRFGWSFGISSNFPRHVIEDGISEGLVRVITSSARYDKNVGEIETWATTIVKNAILAAARKSQQGINRLITMSLDDTHFDDEDGSALEEVAALVDDGDMSWIIEADERKAILHVKRDVARSILGPGVYEIALEEIRGGDGWIMRTSVRVGRSHQAIRARITKARKEFRRIETTIYGYGT